MHKSEPASSSWIFIAPAWLTILFSLSFLPPLLLSPPPLLCLWICLGSAPLSDTLRAGRWNLPETCVKYIYGVSLQILLFSHKSINAAWQAICCKKADINDLTYSYLLVWSDFFASDILWSKVSYIKTTPFLVLREHLPKFPYDSCGCQRAPFFIVTGSLTVGSRVSKGNRFSINWINRISWPNCFC